MEGTCLSLATHLKEMQNLLHFAPHTWIQKILGLSKAPACSFNENGFSSAYIIFSLFQSICWPHGSSNGTALP